MERIIKIHSYFDPPPAVDTENIEPSLTQQHFKDECDVNYIIDRYVMTGVLGDPLNSGSVSPSYGDFSSAIDFHSAQNIIAQATQAFDLLPASVRQRFHNDPSEMLAFLDDDSNREEAVKLGLVDSKKPDSGNPGGVPGSPVNLEVDPPAAG